MPLISWAFAKGTEKNDTIIMSRRISVKIEQKDKVVKEITETAREKVRTLNYEIRQVENSFQNLS